MSEANTIEAELYDGTVLEFPEGTPSEVIQRVAREQTFLRQTSDLIQNPEGEEAPEMTPGRAAGLAGRAAVQAVPGAVAGIPILINDAVQQAGNWMYQGVDKLAGLVGYDTGLADMHRRAWGGPFGTARKWQDRAENLADAAGLPEPATPGERIAVAGGQTALEALGGAGLAKTGEKVAEGTTRRVLADLAEAPVTQTVVGGLAGGGAQLAQENDISPLIGTVGGLALGAGGSTVPTLARQGYRSAVNAMDQALLRTPEAQEQAARARIYDAASDPHAALREIEEGGGDELVPGSRPTTFQATGDMGLGSLERELQTQNPEVFANRRGEQNSARLDSLRSIQGEGNAADVADFLRGQLEDIDRVTAGYETKTRSAAEEAADAIRPSDDADGIGNTIRSSMKEREDTARAREKALWDAVDPDGSLTVSTQGAREAAHRVYGNLSRAAEIGLTPEEKGFRELIASYRPIEPFRELNDLASQVKAAMRAELNSARGRTPAYGRLAQLNEALRSAITKSAAERIIADPAANGRFQALVNDFEAGSREGTRSGNRPYGAVRTGAVSNLGGEAVAQGSGPGSFASNPRVQGQARKGTALSLTQFIAKNGGLPLDAESTARDWGNVSVGRFGKLARPEGRSIDGYWRNKLIEEGYLPRDADGYSSRDITKELYDAIENERAGRKTFTAADQMRLQGFEPDGQEAEFLAASRQLQDELKSVGIRPEEMSPRAFNDAVERLANGEERDAITAYERAVMDLEDEGPVRATYTPREGKSAGSLLDGYRSDPEAGARYDAATKATRERIGTFNKGYAGQILRKEGAKDTFRMGSASVAKNAFMPGPTGGERIKALVKAGARHSDIAEAAAFSLSKHIKDGVLDAKGFQRWRGQYEAALRELPQDVRAKFANASLASQTLERVAALRKQKLDAFNKSLLGRLAKVDTADLPSAMGRILNSSDANKQMAQLVTAANKNPNAKEGLRRAVAEYIQERFISNKEVGASGEHGIRADAFQSFVKSKKQALALVFGQEHVLRLQAIADDIKRAERSLQAVRIPGNSNTAQDVGTALEKAAKVAGKRSLFTQMLIAGGAGFMAGGPKGAALGAGGAWAKDFFGSMRAAGLKKVDDLVLEMMLDPQLAKAALVKAPITSQGAQKLLSQVLARRSVFATTNSIGGSDER